MLSRLDHPTVPKARSSYGQLVVCRRCDRQHAARRFDLEREHSLAASRCWIGFSATLGLLVATHSHVGAHFRKFHIGRLVAGCADRHGGDRDYGNRHGRLPADSRQGAPRVQIRPFRHSTFRSHLPAFGAARGGTTAAVWLWAIGEIRGDEIVVIARNWWLAVAVGMLCITPLVINWMVEGSPRIYGQLREALIVLAAFTAPSVFTFASQLAKQDPVEGVLYASLPILLWASFFLRETGAGISLVAFTVLAIGANVLLPEHAVPIWITAAHIVAFGLISLVTASAHSELERAISARARQRELESLAYTDMLTGLPNRNWLLETLQKAMIAWQVHRTPFALLMIDLDDFKPVNDQFGHRAGDEVLRIIGERLKSICKKDDLIARFGGDEFVAVLGTDDTATAQSIADRILFAIRQPISVKLRETEVNSLQIGASIGIAHSQCGANTVDALLNQADIASYQAKQAGGARVIAA